MINPSYAVVIPTIGRPGLAELIATVDGDPAPTCIVVVDDRHRVAAELDLPETSAPLTVLHTHGRGPAAARNAGWRAVDASVGNRAPPHGEGGSGGAFPPRATTTAVDSPRDARAAEGIDAEWIAFLDDDVNVPRDWCQRLMRDLSNLPDQVAASQAWLHVPAPPQRRPTDSERRTLALMGAPWITADMAYRRAALVATGGFDERFPRAYREDSDLALRTVRLGYLMTWGERVTTHPLASPTNWRSSLKDQAGNADNAWLRAKYGRRWRSLSGTARGRTGRHLITTAAATTALAAVASRGVVPAPRRWARVAAAAGLVWAGLTAEFALGRMLAGPRTAREITTMVVTSALIPPLAVAHRLRGEVRARLGGRDPGRISEKPRAVLFDRDGTLIKNVPYLADPRRVRPMPGARRTLNQLRRQGVAVGVVSNQSGVARGLINSDELAKVNARVESLLGPFDTWQICPHAPDAGCGCRKPEPGLVAAAAHELGVAPDECLMIGDIGSDVEAALTAGARAVLVPGRHTKVAEIDHAHLVAAVAPNLRTAVRRHVGGVR